MNFSRENENDAKTSALKLRVSCHHLQGNVIHRSDAVLNAKLGVRSNQFHTFVLLKSRDFNLISLCVTKNFQHDPRT